MHTGSRKKKCTHTTRPILNITFIFITIKNPFPSSMGGGGVLGNITITFVLSNSSPITVSTVNQLKVVQTVYINHSYFNLLNNWIQVHTEMCEISAVNCLQACQKNILIYKTPIVIIIQHFHASDYLTSKMFPY